VHVRLYKTVIPRRDLTECNHESTTSIVEILKGIHSILVQTRALLKIALYRIKGPGSVNFF